MCELVIGKVLIVIGSSVAASVFSAYEVNKGAISHSICSVPSDSVTLSFRVFPDSFDEVDAMFQKCADLQSFQKKANAPISILYLRT